MVAAVSHQPVLIGRYAIFEQIARGGMATVHIGRLCGPGGFTRTVAVKRLHPGYASDPEFVAMFLDEARLAARIVHPNVVSTLDIVATKGELFMVMEYIHGESLSNLLRAARASNAPVPVEIAAQIAANVLFGLHAAHEATSPEGAPLGIVHRDVSPQNVLVGTDGVARVIDFGIAKAVQRMRETKDGSVKGKVSYMSPEQLSGKEVDRRADVWATAVILWEALANQRLFDYEELGAIVAAALGGNVAPPSKHNPHVPPTLDAVVMKGLAVRPEDRWSTAQEMALALEDAVAPIAPRTIAKWVESTADERLRKKADIISRTEHSPIPMLEPGPVESSEMMIRRGDATLTESSTTTGDIIAVGADASSSLPRAPSGVAPSRKRGFTIVLAGLGVLGVIGSILIVGAIARRTPEAGASVSVPTGTAPPPVTAPPADDTADEPAAAMPEPGAATAPPARGPAPKVARNEKASRAAPVATTASTTTTSSTAPARPVETSAAPVPSPPPPSPPPPATTAASPERPRYVLASARVDVGAATNTSGTSSANVGRAISPVAGRITECYRSALPAATGAVEGPGRMHVATDEDGVIVKVQVSGPVPTAAPCIVSAVSGRRIPNVDTGRARADVPLFFRSQ